MELRNLRYDKGNSNSTFRFRNRTNAVFSLTQETLLMDKNLAVFGYFEAFHNFDNDVVERFFTQYKYKFGFNYGHNFKWRFDLGIIYQEATNNVVDVAIKAVNIITNYIFDWGIAYVIPSKKD